MCRLFGMSAGPRRASATFWLLDAPDSLSAQSHREPDGTGLGWFDAHGSPRVSKQPLAAFEDRAFAQQGRALRSRTFIAHIRFASTGALEERNTHPFEQSGRLFAHNGVLGDLERLDDHLGADRSLVKGDTDSERLFALITRETLAAGGDVERGIEAACAWVAANLPLFAINFVLATADELWALRYPATHDLFVLERAAGAPLANRSTLGTRVASRHGATDPLVVLASERMDDDPGWRPLDSGELLHIAADLHVSGRVILPDEPAHRLTLADLGDRARASQARAAP
ncbi:MAG TPA: class II glutamine amidotransferase [Solirubrobacteraceae bacterium]|jgi:glutamine amidotransferase|nr:class II glutamine amidotransferase [Solirubrobacteraceae bacterium]